MSPPTSQPQTRAQAREQDQSPGPAHQPSRPSPSALPAAKTPVSSGAIATLGLVLAVLLTAVGVAAVRDALVYAGVLKGTPLLSLAARATNGVTPAVWMIPVGIALAVLGLWLLIMALRPRPRKAVTLTAQTGVFLRPKDVSRLAETAAERVDGVLDVRVSAKPKTAKVTVRSTGDQATSDRVRDAVTDRLSALENPPTLKISSTGGNS